MTALGMRLALSRLRKSHGIATPEPVTIPFTPPTERAQVLTGHATTTTVDLQRQRFRGWCFGALNRQPYPPLYFKHQSERGEVGAITNLEYDFDGALVVVVVATDPIARRANAFSVGATVKRFEIMDPASPDYHAIITEAWIEEISLTDNPANPAAIVTHRRDVSAEAEFDGHAATAITCISRSGLFSRKEPPPMSSLQVDAICRRIRHSISPTTAMVAGDGMTLRDIQSFIAYTFTPSDAQLTRLANYLGVK